MKSQVLTILIFSLVGMQLSSCASMWLPHKKTDIVMKSLRNKILPGTTQERVESILKSHDIPISYIENKSSSSADAIDHILTVQRIPSPDIARQYYAIVDDIELGDGFQSAVSVTINIDRAGNVKDVNFRKVFTGP